MRPPERLLYTILELGQEAIVKRRVADTVRRREHPDGVDLRRGRQAGFPPAIALCLTTNLAFKQWGTAFPGAACVVALAVSAMERLIARALDDLEQQPTEEADRFARNAGHLVAAEMALRIDPDLRRRAAQLGIQW